MFYLRLNHVKHPHEGCTSALYSLQLVEDRLEEGRVRTTLQTIFPESPTARINI